ncbi:unnamed protein product [Effrenium voratum]|nr:unnamed protein product [Effrenium voratum]CAJ1435984.1 unnamed protein product [Effrenium voratum]
MTETWHKGEPASRGNASTIEKETEGAPRHKQATGCIDFQIPREGVSSGKVLLHCANVCDRLFTKHSPVIFKIGFTHDPVWRWGNTLYGYVNEREKWTNMTVLYVADERFGPAMLEAALIDKYGRPGCKNVNAGGDNVKSQAITCPMWGAR